MPIRIVTCLFLITFASGVHAAVGQALWSIPFALVSAPAIRPDGSVAAQSADTLLLVGSDGLERWRRSVPASTSNSAQPPMIDDAGNIVVLTATGISSYDGNGNLTWNFPLQFPTIYTSLALGQNGQVVVKTGDDWYLLDRTGRPVWSQTNTGPINSGGSLYSLSPAIIGPDGNIRSANVGDEAEVRSIATGKLVAADRAAGDSIPFADAKLLALGPSAESLVISKRQAPPLDPPLAYLPTPSAGNYRMRWTQPSGTGESWSNAFVLGNPAVDTSNTEPALYGLCAPSGEVLVATAQGTVIMPHDGIGFRRWPETAFAVAENGDILCCDGAHLVVRHADQSVAWSVAAEGTHFTLAPEKRICGGTQTLSAYEAGVGPAVGPWAQPRGDATQQARAPVMFGPFAPHIASVVDAAPDQSLYDSYAGQVLASPYVQGPGAATWEKDGADVGPAADNHGFVIRTASASSAGTYRLRIDTADGPVRSGPIAVSVAPPAPIRPGLYWGKLRAPNNAVYCLEIKPDRTVRYLTSDGAHFTPAMNVRLDPSGAYPWSLPIPQYGASVTFHASSAGVTVSWQAGADEPATPAPAVLPSGARTGWYDGNYVGPLNDDCATELALLPDGTLIGSLEGIAGSVTLPLALDPGALTQVVRVNNGSPFPDQLTVTLDPAGGAVFERRSFPYASSAAVRFEAFAPGTAPDTRLINLSARSRAGSATGTLIAGFVVAEPGTFLVRAVGPTLSQFGVGAPLAAPALRLTRSDGMLVDENDGWAGLGAAAQTALVDAANQAGAFQLRPGSLDAAVVTPLSPGAYTAMMSSADEGEALAEVYVVPPATAQRASRLVNLSTRARLTASNAMLTIGFVHVTEAARRILIRGVGPGLKPFVGDTPVCANPRVRVYDAAGVLIAANDDWTTYGAVAGGSGPSQYDTVSDAAASSGAFALDYNSHDAAVVLNLPGGQYTVQLDSPDGSTGDVLFEVYAVP